MPNDVTDWTTGNLVTLVNAKAEVLGDIEAASPVTPDSASETINLAFGAPLSLGGILDSFKPAAGQVIARVGALGALASVLSGPLTPTFGQATTAGHLLLAWVSGSGASPTTVTAGWVQVGGGQVGSAWVGLWIKPNSGAGEVAPTFTSASSGLQAQLAEFSGVATAAPGDQAAGGDGAGATVSLTMPGPDAAAGDLVVMTNWFMIPKLDAYTLVQTFNNQAAVVHAGDGFVAFLNSRGIPSYSYAINPQVAASPPLGVAAHPYDAMGNNLPAVGTAASVVLPAVAGKRYILAHLAASLRVTTAAADAQELQVLDGAAVIWRVVLSVPATINAQALFAQAMLGLVGTIGNSMTIKFGAALGTAQYCVSAGAYLH